MMAKTSTYAGQWTTATATTTTLRGLVIVFCCLLALVVPSDAGRLLRQPINKGLHEEQQRVLKVGNHKYIGFIIGSLPRSNQTTWCSGWGC